MSKNNAKYRCLVLIIGTYIPLVHVQSAKYLAITFTDNLDWGQHIYKISSMGDFSKTKAMMMRRNSALLKSEEIFFEFCSRTCKTFSRDDVIYRFH